MKNGSGIAALTDQSRRFALNILGVGQKETAAAFFQADDGFRRSYERYSIPIWRFGTAGSLGSSIGM
jgi:hypothetical protein